MCYYAINVAVDILVFALMKMYVYAIMSVYSYYDS